jgi:hypothetical protein
MKIVIGLVLIFFRFFLAFKILSWVGQEINTPNLHNISEIEIYLVGVILDIWITTQNNQIDIEVDNRD